jgi:hypothetical protein
MVEWVCWWRDRRPLGSSREAKEISSEGLKIAAHPVDWHDEMINTNEVYDLVDAPVMQVLHEARDQGICRYIGITADSTDELAYVLNHVEVDTCLEAYGYNIMFRRGRKIVLPLTQRKGSLHLCRDFQTRLDQGAPRVALLATKLASS